MRKRKDLVERSAWRKNVRYTSVEHWLLVLLIPLGVFVSVCSIWPFLRVLSFWLHFFSKCLLFFLCTLYAEDGLRTSKKIAYCVQSIKVCVSFRCSSLAFLHAAPLDLLPSGAFSLPPPRSNGISLSESQLVGLRSFPCFGIRGIKTWWFSFAETTLYAIKGELNNVCLSMDLIMNYSQTSTCILSSSYKKRSDGGALCFQNR